MRDLRDAHNHGNLQTRNKLRKKGPLPTHAVRINWGTVAGISFNVARTPFEKYNGNLIGYREDSAYKARLQLG